MIRNKKAFTLVEMLAVIIILGILVALSFPKILEMVEKENGEISDAELQLIYTATKSYLYDNANQYPAREGKNYCITMDALVEGDYLAIDSDNVDMEKAVKVSYFSDEEYQLTYVDAKDCN
jgi:type IV pilus assembly protein PilA